MRRWTIWFDLERATEAPRVSSVMPGSRSGRRWGRPVEVIPLSEVREALLSEEVKRAVAEVLDEEFSVETNGEAITDDALAEKVARAIADAAFTKEEK